jgi:hypothetical protein
MTFHAAFIGNGADRLIVEERSLYLVLGNCLLGSGFLDFVVLLRHETTLGRCRFRFVGINPLWITTKMQNAFGFVAT